MVHRRQAGIRAQARRQHRSHPRAARQAQADTTHRRVELWIGVHQSAGRSCGASDRKRGPQGVSHRRCVGVRQAREFHHQSRRRTGRRRRGSDPPCAEHGGPGSWNCTDHRSAHRRGTVMSLLNLKSTARRAQSATDFGKVAVLLGGDSTEREISLLSGNAVLAALLRRGVNAHAFDPQDRPVQNLASEGFDRVWIALHGPGGEDGLMQGALEWLGVPYTGSGVLASALTMDKLKPKRVVVGAGYAAPEYAVLSQASDLPGALARIGLPLMVKPASQGSSVGITKVKTAAELPRAYAEASAIDPIVFAEAFVTGDEFTVGVLHDAGLPSIRIQPATEFYDYQAKYFRSDTQYHCPSGLDAKAEAELQAAALAAFRVTDCTGWGRVDFMRDRAGGKFYFIEINTTPGMTDHSLVPMAARQSGMDFEELVWRVLESSFSRERKP